MTISKVNNLKQKFIQCHIIKEYLGAAYLSSQILGNKESEGKILEAIGEIHKQIESKGNQLQKSIILTRRLLGREEPDGVYWQKLQDSISKETLEISKKIWEPFTKGIGHGA